MIPLRTSDVSGFRWERNGLLPRARAFSLIELVVVIAIILFLSSLYLKSNTGGSAASRAAACQQNLETIFVALKTYAADHREAYPVVTNAATAEAPLSLLIPRYTSVTESFICPASRHAPLPEAAPFTNRRISYAYWMGRTTADGADAALMADALVDTRAKLAGQPLFSSDGKRPGNNHRRGGGNILFGDGQVRHSPTNAAMPLPATPGVILLNPKSSL